MLLQQGGYTEADAELVKTGGFGEGIAALDSGQIDVAAITEPLWSKVKHKYRAVVVASEVLPPLDNVVGVTTVEMAEKKGDFLRAVIRARRKAVQFMIANPDEAADDRRQGIQARPRRREERRAQSRHQQDPGRAVLGRGRRSTWPA